MTISAYKTRALAGEIATVLGADGPHVIDTKDSFIEVWRTLGADQQPVVIQYHPDRDALRINHGPYTGLWFDPHSGETISYYGWPSDPIRVAADVLNRTIHEGEDMVKRGEDHQNYDHEPNDLDLALLRLIKDYITEEGRPPTIREMADRAGVASTTSITFRLKRLVRFGMIERGPHKSSRTMRIADEWKD